MSLSQIHQVVGQSVSNPDHAEWLVATYGVKEDADKHAAFLNEFYRMANDPANNPDPFRMLLDALRDNHPFDQGFVDNGEVTYVVRSQAVLCTTPSLVDDVNAAFAVFKADFEKEAEKNKAVS